jgi:hypothetical protein
MPSGIRLARNRPERSQGRLSASSHWSIVAVYWSRACSAGEVQDLGDVVPAAAAFAGVDHGAGQDILGHREQASGVVDVVVGVAELVRVSRHTAGREVGRLPIRRGERQPSQRPSRVGGVSWTGRDGR